MADNDSNLIVRLVPLNEKTRRAWKNPHNASFYVPASHQASEHRQSSSGKTPLPDNNVGQKNKASYPESHIELMINDFPKDVTKGFVFGSNKDSCDIYCGRKSNAFNISARAFSITVDKRGQVLLKNLNPKSWISVQYGDQEPGVRTSFTWILFSACEEGIIVEVAERLKFRAIVPRNAMFSEAYREACYEYVTNVESAVAAIPIPTSVNQPVTASPSQMPGAKTGPFYYREKEIGSGFFGKVYLVRDVSTGKEYAGKEYDSDYVYDEGHILACQNHNNIVKYIGFTSEGGPLIVMEYLPGGNLADPWRTKDEWMWNEFEIAGILYQCLHALAHLHAKPNTIHRDIKPENILVERRYWFLCVKIGDFGLTKEGDMLGGKDDSWTYTSPEVLSDGHYTTSMDIWSLGVVMMEMFLKGRLPEPKDGVSYGTNWCNTLEKLAVRISIASTQKDRTSSQPLKKNLRTELWSLIVNHMLKVDPKTRTSAKECIDAGRYTVFSHYYLSDIVDDTDDDTEA